MYHDLWHDPETGPMTQSEAHWAHTLGLHMQCPVCDRYIHSPSLVWGYTLKSVSSPAQRHLLRHTKDELMPYYMAVMV
jgi:hypothetical protein